MDEILATIRRIIAEDERSSGPAERGAPADGRHEVAGGHKAAAGANSVLDLTDMLNEDGSIERLDPVAPAPGVPNPRLAPAFAETEIAAPNAPAAHPRTDRTAQDEATSEMVRAADPGPSPSAMKPFGANDERLVSDAAALAAATAFGRIAAIPSGPREPPLVGGRPLDEIVRELLRPLLRTWLDENLPGIVERLVQAEIARISARSGSG